MWELFSYLLKHIRKEITLSDTYCLPYVEIKSVLSMSKNIWYYSIYDDYKRVITDDV